MTKAQSSSIYHKRRRLEAKRNGYCAKCYNAKARPSKLTCQSCRDKQSAWNKSKSGKDSRKKYLSSPKGKAKIRRENKRAKPGHAAYMRKWRNNETTR